MTENIFEKASACAYHVLALTQFIKEILEDDPRGREVASGYYPDDGWVVDISSSSSVLLFTLRLDDDNVVDRVVAHVRDGSGVLVADSECSATCSLDELLTWVDDCRTSWASYDDELSGGYPDPERWLTMF